MAVVLQRARATSGRGMLLQMKCRTSGAMQGTTTRTEVTCSTCQSSSRTSSKNVWKLQRSKSASPYNQRSSSTLRDPSLCSTSVQKLHLLPRALSPTRTGGSRLPTAHLPHHIQDQGAALLRHDQTPRCPPWRKQQALQPQVRTQRQQQSRQKRPSSPHPHSLPSAHKASLQTSSRVQDRELPTRCLLHLLCVA